MGAGVGRDAWKVHKRASMARRAEARRGGVLVGVDIVAVLIHKANLHQERSVQLYPGERWWLGRCVWVDFKPWRVVSIGMEWSQMVVHVIPA